VTHFKGTITGAGGGLLHLTIMGPEHFQFDRSYTQSFDESIDLMEGSYTVTMSATTPGKFTFEVCGDYTSIDPQVPESFHSFMRMYELQV
jgi:hypothetical protein